MRWGDVLNYFYIKNYMLAKYLPEQDIEPLEHFLELIDMRTRLHKYTVKNG